MARGIIRQFIAIAQPPLDFDQIFDLNLGGIRLPASRAGDLLLLPDVPVEFHAELRRPLKYMEQLSEGKPEQREDDCDGVQQREES